MCIHLSVIPLLWVRWMNDRHSKFMLSLTKVFFTQVLFRCMWWVGKLMAITHHFCLFYRIVYVAAIGLDGRMEEQLGKHSKQNISRKDLHTRSYVFAALFWTYFTICFVFVSDWPEWKYFQINVWIHSNSLGNVLWYHKDLFIVYCIQNWTNNLTLQRKHAVIYNFSIWELPTIFFMGAFMMKTLSPNCGRAFFSFTCVCVRKLRGDSDGYHAWQTGCPFRVKPTVRRNNGLASPSCSLNFRESRKAFEEWEVHTPWNKVGSLLWRPKRRVSGLFTVR